MFILLVHQHLNTGTERIHWTYKALCCGKALQGPRGNFLSFKKQEEPSTLGQTDPELIFL